MSEAPTDDLVLRHWPTRLCFEAVSPLLLAGTVAMAREAVELDFAGRPERVLLVAHRQAERGRE